MWYSGVACFTVLIVGGFVSLATGRNRGKTVDPELLCPAVESFFGCWPKSVRSFLAEKELLASMRNKGMEEAKSKEESAENQRFIERYQEA